MKIKLQRFPATEKKFTKVIQKKKTPPLLRKRGQGIKP